MPAIKINLSRLIELFGKSVNSDLPEPVRALAARLMTLTAHVIRVDNNTKALGEQIKTLTDVVHALMQSKEEQNAAPQPAAQPATQPASQPVSAQPTAEQEEVDEDFERMRAEAEAEVAAEIAAAPEAQVTPLPRKIGGKK
jgi:hypothetical protein